MQGTFAKREDRLFDVHRRLWSAIRSIKTAMVGRILYCQDRCKTTMVIKILDETVGETSLEAVAAAIGMIKPLNIRTIETIPLKGASWEAQQIIFPLIQEMAGRVSSQHLSSSCTILVMPFIPGTVFRCLGEQYIRSLPSERTMLHQALGRLWCFDLLIENTDRFLRGKNSSNIIVSSCGTVYGIDQRLGRGALDFDRKWKREIDRVSNRLVGPGDRKGLFSEIFHGLNNDLRGFKLQDEESFCRAFEQGFLSSLKAIETLRIEDIRSQIESSSIDVRRAAQDLDLSGIAGILAELKTVSRALRD